MNRTYQALVAGATLLLGSSAALSYHGYGPHGSPRYVCYNNNSTVQTQSGHHVVVYYGCRMSYSSCNQLGMRHFGRYSSGHAARQALWRCRNSKPRFVD